MNAEQELSENLAQLANNQAILLAEIEKLKSRPVVDPFSYYKTPDPIKNISNFSGNKRETLAWIQEVEETLTLYKDYVDEPIYPQLIRAVKSKIIGDAKEILIAAGNPSDWQEIKDVLLNSYGDKRDLASHIQSLFYITMGKKTISEYFNKIKQIDTSIKSTANASAEFDGATKQINALIGLITTTRFVDGLGEGLSMIVRSHKPESLEEAYTYATQYSNAAYRQKLEKNNFKTIEQPMKKPSNFAEGKWKPNQQTNPMTTQNKFEGIKPKTPSGKFKAPIPNEDVSMRTYRSKAQINNHEEKIEEEDQPPVFPTIDSMDSDEDEYFIADEINFQVEVETGSKR